MNYIIKISGINNSANLSCEANKTVSEFYDKIAGAELTVAPGIAIFLAVNDMLDLSYDLSHSEKPAFPFWLQKSTVPFEDLLGHQLTVKKRVIKLNQTIVLHCEID
jgi:hypothetical protein